MKLFIFTCLVAVALAKPNLPLRHSELIQNEQDSVEPITRKIREEYINELNKRELLTENQSDELKKYIMNDPEQKIASSSSSSEEQLNKYNQLQLEAVHDQEQVPRANEYNRIQLPFQQRGAYPYAAWYYPSQIMQYIPYSPFYDINKPIASENDEKTDIMPEW
ncbi:casein alpha s1 [Rhinolophus ferrumequinum]|uniref:Alpha-S1-casein n=1 Tax=Rhinolophus ferrumequinum TaxID=59479 RepID=A0A7J7ZBX6_RHIFE|nr:casein alpha s1 [Rhinolophus ferrumequinum]